MDELSVDVYRRTGVAVLRHALPQSLVAQWMDAWSRFYNSDVGVARSVDPFNPVLLREPVSAELATMHRHPLLLDVMERIYPDLGLFIQRFLLKDVQSRAPVFVHQDFGYDIGWPEKTSMFVPLSPMTPENGGMLFYPGTHRLGYLGDVGEIDVAAVAPDWPVVCPALAPGDLVLMHECTWHGSGPHVGGPDRVLAQIQYQPASDPSCIAVLRGRSDTAVRVDDDVRGALFKRSRSSRVRELQEELSRLKDASSLPGT